MDEKKLLKRIEQKKEEQADKIFNCVKKIVKRDYEYYKNKDYAKKFLE